MEIEYKSPTPNSYDRINGPKIKFMHRSSGSIGSALSPTCTLTVLPRHDTGLFKNFLGATNGFLVLS